jgi:hypothetical protein
MENSSFLHAEVMVGTYRIEKAIMDCHRHAGDNLTPEATMAFQDVMAEVYEMRRTLKMFMSEDNKATVARLSGKDRRYPDRQ